VHKLFSKFTGHLTLARLGGLDPIEPYLWDHLADDL
jgi:hypothetical protein